MLSSVVLRSALTALPRIRQQAVAALLSPDWQVENPVNKVNDRQDIAFFRRSPVCSGSTAAYPATSCFSTSTTRLADGKSLQQGRRIGRIFLSSVVLRSALTALPRIRRQAVAALLPPDWRRVRNPFSKVDVSAGYCFLLSFSGLLLQHCHVSGNKLLQHFCHQTGGRKSLQQGRRIGRILLSSVVLRSALAALPRIRQQAVAALLSPDWRVENPFNKVEDRQDIAFFCRSPVRSRSTAAYPATSCCSTSTTRPAGGKSLQQGRRIGRIFLSSVVLRSALTALPRIRRQAVAALLPPDWRRVRNPFSKVDVSAGYFFLLSFSGPLSQHCRVSGDKLSQHFCHQTGGG